jgi:hypothetical protein
VDFFEKFRFMKLQLGSPHRITALDDKAASVDRPSYLRETA